jgi:O-antigen/teichoic acid export membrane protein
LESYAWQQRKAVLSNFSREVLFRFFTTILIVFTTVGIINSFDIFIKIYSFLYLLLAAILISYFAGKGKFHFVFEISKVTRRFSKKIITLCSFVWGGSLVYTLALVFDTIVIAAVMPNGAAAAGIFFLAQNISALIQAPQRGIISASIGPLSQAWKEKNYKKINLIYHRSSINQLIFSCAMFCLIWLNFTDGVYTFDLKETYLQGQMVFLFIGLARIIDMGTGVNAQIIATSNYWRFEFITGIALLAITLPLSYILAREIGIIGPAVASLVALIIYNGIRFFFLYSKFKMQPFTLNSLYTLMLAAFAYFIAFILFRQHTGLVWIIARSSLFIAIYGCGMVLLNLTPDLKPVLVSVKRKLRL